MSSNIRVVRICQYCKNEFEARTTVTKTCSDACAKRLYKQKQKQEKVLASDIEMKTLLLRPITELQTKDFLSISEACLLIGVSRRTIYRLIANQVIKVGKAGSRTLIKRTEIEKIFA
jgi:excisionase family DNA binding protein